MTVSKLTGRLLNNQPFLVSTSSQGGTSVAPGALTIVAGAISDTTFFITWSAPSTGTGSFTYQPKYKLHSASTYTNFGSPITSTASLVTGLTASTNYDFAVDVTNGTTPDNTSNVLNRQTNSASSSGVPGPLTDIIWTQPYAMHPLSKGADNFAAVGWADPVGGIGPYVWSISTDSSVSTTAYTLIQASGQDRRPLVSVGYINELGAQTDHITLTCRDGRGVSAPPKTVLINKTDGSADVKVMNDRNPNHNASNDAFNHGPYFRPQISGTNWVGGAGLTGTVINTAAGQASNIWDASYNVVRPRPAPVPADSYPVRVGMQSNADNTRTATMDYTIQIVDYTPITYIELNTIAFSTASPIGYVLGSASATTPHNNPTWTINEPSGTLSIAPSTGVVKLLKTPTNTNPISFSITVTDDLATFTHAFTLTPLQGTVLAPTNMTFTQNSVNNHTLGQTIGTPHVTGINGTIAWALLDYTDLNLGLHYRDFGQKELLSMNASTGVITQWDGITPGSDSNYPYLAAKTYQLKINATDGTNSCTQTFSLVVDPPTTTTTYHVGRGMAAAHPGFGFDHWIDVMMTSLITTPHNDKKVFMIHADSDPEYFTNDWNGTGTGAGGNGYPVPVGLTNPTGGFQMYIGPWRLEGVSLPNGTQARFGGASSGQQQSYAHPRYGGSPFRLGPADCEIVNMEFSGFHSPPDTYSGCTGALYKDQAYGDLLIQNCVFRDNDFGLISPPGQQTTIFDHCEFTQSTNSVLLSAGGLSHTIYFEGSNLVMDHCVFRGSGLGHLVKTRSKASSITNCRIFDGLTGNAAHQINYPVGGKHYLANCFIQKGTEPRNQDMIRYGEDIWCFQENSFIAENNIFIVESLPNSMHYGSPSVLGWMSRTDPFTGTRSTCTLTNNQYFIFSGLTNFIEAWDYDSNGGPQIDNTSPYWPTVVNCSPLTLPLPALDQTRPYLAGNLPQLHNAWKHTSGPDEEMYPNFNHRNQVPDQLELRVPHTASTGTVICNIFASTDADSILGGIGQEFNTTTTWAIEQDNTLYYGGGQPVPWAPVGRYTVTKNSDGTATLKVGTGMPSGPAIDLVQLTATCGTAKTTQWYVITVT